MLITVSGIVGGGKTTVANELVRLLRAQGATAACWRFQALPCFTLLRSRSDDTTSRVQPAAESSPTKAHGSRWRDYRRRRLTATTAAVYVARILAFQIYRLSWRRGHWRVMNRYFYDLFVHYRLTSRTERLYFAVIRALLPRPDLALLVDGRPATIAARRPQYSAEYLSEVAQAYGALPLRFPELIKVHTDADEPALERVSKLLAVELESRRGL